MGRIFALPPSRWEIDNARVYIDGKEHMAQFGDLPDNAGWHMLERRYDLNPVRFHFFHPNTAVLIELAHHDEPGRPGIPPIDRCSPYEHECGCEQPPPHEGSGEQNVVPEPPALVSMGAAIVVWFAAFLWLRRTAKKSVAEG